MLAEYAAVVGWISLLLLLGGGALLLSRRGRLRQPSLRLLIVLLALSLPSFALERRHGEFVTVAANEIVDDTLLASGNTVRVEGVVNGDVLAFGRTVEVRGTVKGDLVSCAQRIKVSGTVEGHIYTLSHSLDLDGQLGHSIYGLVQSLRLEERGQVGEGIVVGAGEPDSLVEVEFGAGELTLPHVHLDVTFARNSRAVGNVHIFHLAHASAQVAADSGRVRQRKAASGHRQIAADTAAHISIAREDVHAALHHALEADVAGSNHDAFAHVAPVIHTQRLHQAVEAATQLPVQVERVRQGVDVAFHGSADLDSLGTTHQVALNGAAHFHGPSKRQQISVDHAFYAHSVTGGQKSVVHSLVRGHGDELSVTAFQGKAGQRQRKQHDQQAQAGLA